MKSTKRKPSIKSKDFKTPPNQQTITQFFNKENGNAVQAIVPVIKQSNAFQEGVVIDILDSDSDSAEEKPTASNEGRFETCSENLELENRAAADLNGKPIDDIPKLGAVPDGDDALGSDSGDEILSGMDIEKFIGSQERRLSQSGGSTTNSPLKLTPENNESSRPKVINNTPIKSPKSKITYYSPLRRLNSPARARNKSGGSKSSSTSNGTTSGQKFKATDSTKKQAVSTSPVKSSVVKQLQFPDSSKETQFMPYYLRHFTAVLDSVTSDALCNHLFDDSDQSIVTKFRDLSSDAKCLFLRLFCRKWNWKPACSIKYPEIKEDLTPLYSELHSSEFLIEIRDVQDQLELQTLLQILNAEQIASLAKQMNTYTSSKPKTKKALSEALMTVAKARPIFATASSIDDIIKKKALELLGRTYQIDGTCRDLFSRLFIMHSPPQYWEDEQEQSTNQLLKMLMADNGSMLYPQCNPNKATAIYKDRDELVRFHHAWNLHCNITAHLESKDWEEVIKIGENAATLLKQFLNDPDVQNSDASLPSFLRVYKACSVLTRVVWLSVEGYQKLKKYRDANEHIHFLLRHNHYLTQYRGRWYERLDMNQKQYLKTSLGERKLSLETALNDNFLLDSHKLCISERLEKILEEMQRPPKKKVKTSTIDNLDKLTEIDNCDLECKTSTKLFNLSQKLPTRTIQGEKLFNPNSGKSVFISRQDGEGSSNASSVELFAVSHYQDHFGYTNGVHAEGAVVCSLFGLLFWDEIYNEEIPDSFHSRYQVLPLDMNFDDFFIRRQGLILDKLEGMRSSWSIEDAMDILEKNWNQNFNVLSVVNWSVFPDVWPAKTLLKRMGLIITAAICERLARNYRHWRSGFPDLVLWSENDFIFVEVKGPGDTLSHKQKVWLDFLLSIGAKAEVCHVQAVSNKKIRT